MSERRCERLPHQAGIVCGDESDWFASWIAYKQVRPPLPSPSLWREVLVFVPGSLTCSLSYSSQADGTQRRGRKTVKTGRDVRGVRGGRRLALSPALGPCW